MLAEYYNGDLTVFDKNTEVPFSPFRGVYDEEKIAFLTKLISSAIQLTSPSFQLESEHQTAITKALKLAYLKKVSATRSHLCRGLGGTLQARHRQRGRG